MSVTRHHCVSDLDMVQETEVTMESDGLKLRHRDDTVEDEARGCEELDVQKTLYDSIEQVLRYND